MQSLPDNTFDICVCSCPYNLDIRYHTYNDNKPHEEYMIWVAEWSKEIKRILKDNGSFFLNVGQTNTKPFIAEQICTTLLDLFILQNHIVWIKNISINEQSFGHFKPINSTRYLNNCWEKIFHFTKDGEVGIDRLSIGVPYVHKSNVTRWKKEPSDRRCAGNCWFLPYKTTTKQKEHPAGFPVGLPERCIRLHGITEDTYVIDPFLGAGTTLLACQNLGIRGLGIEIDPTYCEIANHKLSQGRHNDHPEKNSSNQSTATS
jgi:site-specific DNA-methyltransferase (adenine-specific)